MAKVYHRWTSTAITKNHAPSWCLSEDNVDISWISRGREFQSWGNTTETRQCVSKYNLQFLNMICMQDLSLAVCDVWCALLPSRDHGALNNAASHEVMIYRACKLQTRRGSGSCSPLHITLSKAHFGLDQSPAPDSNEASLFEHFKLIHSLLEVRPCGGGDSPFSQQCIGCSLLSA